MIGHLLTPMSDQNRISPYNINQKGDGSKKKCKFEDFLGDLLPNSLNWHHKNCMADSKENY